MKDYLDESYRSTFVGFDDHVAQVMETWQVHGTAIAVVKGGSVIFSKGYGYRDFAKKLPVDSETLFAIGSASKAFTTTAMGILVDRGLLEWDRPVRDYLPFFKLADPLASERITARDLVCHRSGLPGHNMMWFGSDASRRELVERMAWLQPSKDFRTTFQYQNMMFVAAGYLIEHLTGMTWEAFVQAEIFDKLGMVSSDFSVEISRLNPNVAHPYRFEEEEIHPVPFANIDTVGPAGSINSNLKDMAKWVILQLNKGVFNGERLISKASLAQIFSPTTHVPDDFFGPLGQYDDLKFESYGLGWFVQHYRGRKLIHHGGHIDGYAALISFMPEIDAGVVFLANDNRTFYVLPLSINVYDLLLGHEPEPWSERILAGVEEVAGMVKSSQVEVEGKRKHGSKPSHPLADYAGEYHHPGYGALKVMVAEEQLVITFNGQDMPLDHFHYDVFTGTYEEEGNAKWVRVHFIPDLDGEINAVLVPFEPAVDAIRFERR